jgi:hypothetical protein
MVIMVLLETIKPPTVYNLPMVNFSICHFLAPVHTSPPSMQLKVCDYILHTIDGIFTIVSEFVTASQPEFHHVPARVFILDYQKDVVQSYLKNYPPPYLKTTYNSSGLSREFPDLLAKSANYVVAISPSHSYTSINMLTPDRPKVNFHLLTAHLQVTPLLKLS